MVGEYPDRGGSRQRSDLGSGIRSFHVELAAARSGAAAHVLYYRVNESDPALPSVLILRVLHQAMEPGRHLTRELP
jgi:toxin ParE1/3/4